MPKSDDPQRAGGKYEVWWVDNQGLTHRLYRPTVGQARKLMKHKKSQGFVSWMKPV